MTPKFINVLSEHKESAHVGRGEYTSFCSGFYLTPILVDLDSFFKAGLTDVVCRSTNDGKTTHTMVVHLAFTKGDYTVHYDVTFEEFYRVFGYRWPVAQQQTMLNELVIRPKDVIDRETANVIQG